jgi:predicted transport protein
LVSKESFFAKRPPELKRLFDTIVKEVKKFGDFREEAVKPDTVFFKAKSTFMAIKVKKDHLVVEYFLDHLEDVPPVFKYLQTSKNRVAHLVAVDRKENITPWLVSNLKFSYGLVNGS